MQKAPMAWDETWLHPGTTKMTMEKQPFEDVLTVFPVKKMIFHCHVSFRGNKHHLHLQLVLCLAAKSSDKPRIVQRLLFLVLPRLWPCHALSTYVNLVSAKKNVHILGILASWIRGENSPRFNPCFQGLKLKIWEFQEVQQKPSRPNQRQKEPATSESSCSKRKITRSFFSSRRSKNSSLTDGLKGTLLPSEKGLQRKKTYQLIQAVTLWSPIVGGHQQPFKGSHNHHKKVTKTCYRFVFVRPKRNRSGCVSVSLPQIPPSQFTKKRFLHQTSRSFLNQNKKSYAIKCIPCQWRYFPPTKSNTSDSIKKCVSPRLNTSPVNKKYAPLD